MKGLRLHWKKLVSLNCIIFLLLSSYSSGLAEHSDEEIIQPETAQELYKILVGNTVIATTSFDNDSREYHSPDGRVLGYNWSDTEKNIDSCWRVTSKNTVCYYYPDWGGNTCWYYKFSKRDVLEGYVVSSPSDTIQGIIKKGNPDNLTDHGQNWSCGEQIVAGYQIDNNLTSIRSESQRTLQ